MMPSSTLSYSDLYGPRTPNGQSNLAPATERSSGGIPAGPENAPGLAWAGILVLLVILRIAFEMAE